MKAAIYKKYGSPDVLRIKDIEKPTPEDNEVLIKVHATTVNRTDCANLRAHPFFMRIIIGLLRPKKSIPGTDFAGQIEAVGKDVFSFNIGDKVFGFNDEVLSSHAQYLALPEDQSLLTIPENCSYEEAAASSEGAHYAYNFINKVDIENGQKILVNGATGAIGSAAVQLLKIYEADVTAVCNTKNLELVKSLGADKIIDYEKEDFTKQNQKYDYIFDTVGKSSFGKCKPLLNSGGVYISSELGWMYQNFYYAFITPILGNKKVVFPIPIDIKRSLHLIKKLIEEGKFNAIIDRKYPFRQIVDAYKYVEKGQKTGNVVIILEE